MLLIGELYSRKDLLAELDKLEEEEQINACKLREIYESKKKELECLNSQTISDL